MVVAYNIVRGKDTLSQFTMANMPLLSNTSVMLRYLNSQMYDHPIKSLSPEIISLLSKEQYNMYVTIIVSLLIFYLIIRDLYVLLEGVEKIFKWKIFIMDMIISIMEIQALVSLNYFLIEKNNAMR